MVDSDHGRLGEHDAAAANVDEGVRCAKVDGDVARPKTCEEVEETDELLLSVWFDGSCFGCQTFASWGAQKRQVQSSR